MARSGLFKSAFDLHYSCEVLIWTCPKNVLKKEHSDTYYKNKIISRKPAANRALWIIDNSRTSLQVTSA